MKQENKRHLPTSEEIVANAEGPLLDLTLICNRCESSTEYQFEYVLIDSKAIKNKNADWDGIFLPKIVECRRCGSVDDYHLGTFSYLRLTAGMIKTAHSMKSNPDAKGNSRIIFGVSQLWDGTIAHRPSQVLSHLRELAERDPRNGEAWLRLGNAQERFGTLEDAEKSWRKALDVDPDKLEAIYSLANLSAERDLWPEAFKLIRQGIRQLPSTKDIDPDHRSKMSEAFVYLLEWTLDITDEPIALAAGWIGEQDSRTLAATVSSVDLRKVEDLYRIAELLISEDVISADLISELPKEEPTILQRRLNGYDPSPSDSVVTMTIRAPSVNPMRRVGRNDPCPCGSGKKYKRCCGQ